MGRQGRGVIFEVRRSFAGPCHFLFSMKRPARRRLRGATGAPPGARREDPAVLLGVVLGAGAGAPIRAGAFLFLMIVMIVMLVQLPFDVMLQRCQMCHLSARCDVSHDCHDVQC